MVSTRNRTRLLAGALMAAVVAVPVYDAAVTSDAGTQVNAAPRCLAWFGNKEDGKCLSYSNGNGVNIGTPDIGIYGPNAGSMPGGGIGITTGPLLPGHTWQWEGGVR